MVRSSEINKIIQHTLIFKILVTSFHKENSDKLCIIHSGNTLNAIRFMFAVHIPILWYYFVTKNVLIKICRS